MQWSMQNAVQLNLRCVVNTFHAVGYFVSTVSNLQWAMQTCSLYDIILILKHNQRDATLYNVLYFCQCSTSFEQSFRSSSGAQKLYMQHGVLAKLVCCYHQQ
jgi:hypothetical protein